MVNKVNRNNQINTPQKEPQPGSLLNRSILWLRADRAAGITHHAKRAFAFILAGFMALSLVGIVPLVFAIRKWQALGSASTKPQIPPQVFRQIQSTNGKLPAAQPPLPAKIPDAKPLDVIPNPSLPPSKPSEPKPPTTPQVKPPVFTPPQDSPPPSADPLVSVKILEPEPEPAFIPHEPEPKNDPKTQPEPVIIPKKIPEPEPAPAFIPHEPEPLNDPKLQPEPIIVPKKIPEPKREPAFIPHEPEPQPEPIIVPKEPEVQQVPVSAPEENLSHDQWVRKFEQNHCVLESVVRSFLPNGLTIEPEFALEMQKLLARLPNLHFYFSAPLGSRPDPKIETFKEAVKNGPKDALWVLVSAFRGTCPTYGPASFEILSKLHVFSLYQGFVSKGLGFSYDKKNNQTAFNKFVKETTNEAMVNQVAASTKAIREMN